MRCVPALLMASLVLVVPTVASAQEDCEGDDWFCEKGSAEAPIDQDVTLPEDEASEDETPVVIEDSDGRKKRGRLIVVEDDHEPPKPKRRRIREWGLNLRLEGALMGNDDQKDPDAGMGGLGFSLRYRPVPHFSFDAGVDFIGGTDWNGNRRSEAALLLSGIVFFNPRDRFQIYTIGGIGWSGAEVDVIDDESVEAPERESYRYFGGHLGIGGELRVGRKVALNLDILGFIRGRTDVRHDSDPEFVDPETHRATNSSGGGLVRGGLTFYW
jgi:hypothetical protein